MRACVCVCCLHGCARACVFGKGGSEKWERGMCVCVCAWRTTPTISPSLLLSVVPLISRAPPSRTSHSPPQAARVEPNSHTYHLLIDLQVVKGDIPAMHAALEGLEAAGECASVRGGRGGLGLG